MAKAQAVKKKPIQRRWVIGKEYEIHSDWGKRRFTLVARTNIDGRETLLLQPVRRASKVWS